RNVTGVQTCALPIWDGDNRKEIEQLAKNYGIGDHIRFLGVREDIATMLHSMDAFIFPSHYEGLGLVLLEAQACNVPCVTSDVITIGRAACRGIVEVA